MRLLGEKLQLGRVCRKIPTGSRVLGNRHSWEERVTEKDKLMTGNQGWVAPTSAEFLMKRKEVLGSRESEWAVQTGVGASPASPTLQPSPSGPFWLKLVPTEPLLGYRFDLWTGIRGRIKVFKIKFV